MIRYYVSWIDKNNKVQVKSYKTEKGADNFAYKLLSNNENEGYIEIVVRDIFAFKTLNKYTFN